jgi:hypothetical protein
MQVHGASWAPFSAWPCIFCSPAATTADVPSMSTRNQGTHGTMRHKQMPHRDVCNVPAPLPPPAQHALAPSAMAVNLTMRRKQTSRRDICNVPAALPPPPLPPARHTSAPSAMAVDSPLPAPPATALEGTMTTDTEVETVLRDSAAVELTYQ